MEDERLSAQQIAEIRASVDTAVRDGFYRASLAFEKIRDLLAEVTRLQAERDEAQRKLNEALSHEGQKDNWIDMLSESLRSVVVAVSGDDDWEGSVADGIDLLNARFVQINEQMEQTESALAGLRAQTTWQPIETAPKDATTVLLGWPKMVVSGHWNPRRDAWITEHGEYREAIGPECWQPLPPAPAGSGKEG